MLLYTSMVIVTSDISSIPRGTTSDKTGFNVL